MLNIRELFITNLLNYSPGRGNRNIEGIVLHTEAAPQINGTDDRSLFDWFNNNSRRVSAHYYVTFSGNIEQYVRDRDTAHHAGVWNSNRITIGIEHQDNGFPDRYTDEQLEASAQLVATLCVMYDIPPQSPNASTSNSGINIHRNVPGVATACPGTLDTQRIIDRATEIIASSNTEFLLQTIEQLKEVLSQPIY